MVTELTDKHLAAINRGRKAKGLKPIRRKKSTSKKAPKKTTKNSQWKNKSITKAMKNGKPVKKGDKPPYTYKKYTYKVKLSKRNKDDPRWLYDYVELQKEPPKNHIADMIAEWSVFEIKTPKHRYTSDSP